MIINLGENGYFLIRANDELWICIHIQGVTRLGSQYALQCRYLKDDYSALCMLDEYGGGQCFSNGTSFPGEGLQSAPRKPKIYCKPLYRPAALLER